MRIVWTAVAFLAGTATAISSKFAPSYALPELVFFFFIIAAIFAAIALIMSRRRAAIPLLCVIFLIGMWRGADAIDEVVDAARTSINAPQSQSQSWLPLQRLRTDIATTLSDSLGADSAGLSTAMLTGDRSVLSDQVTSDFRASGLAHLLAISGLHVSLIGGIAMTASVLVFGRRRSIYLLFPLLIVLVYAALAGFAPPITRAAIMFAVFILARATGRGSHTLAALALAATVMVAIDPAILASLSFQLSFAAMLGISFVAPVLENFTEITTSGTRGTSASTLMDRIRRFVTGSLVVSLAATLATFPLIALHFGQIPIWGALATLLSVPAMPLLIVSSALLAVAGQLPVPWISEIAAVQVDITTQYLTKIASLFARLPPQPIETSSWTAWLTVAYYATSAVIVALWPRIIDKVKSVRQYLTTQIPLATGQYYELDRPLMGFAIVATLVGIAGWGATVLHNDPKPFTSVRFLETSHGESILIESPNQTRVLIDGGGDPSQVADILAGLLPFNDRKIDIVMLTHSDADHVGGLPEVLRRFEVKHVIHSGLTSTSDVYASWSETIGNREGVIIARPDSIIGLDQNIYLEIISAGCPDGRHPCTDVNDASIVTRLRHNDVGFLFTGDIEKIGEAWLATTEADLHANILKAPHHGSNTSSSQTLLDAVNPSAVVVAAGTGNRYGHPDPEVIQRLVSTVGKERVLRTDLLGTVELRTDGERLWMVR